MHVTVVHNPKAGHSPCSEDRLLNMLRTAGYDPNYCAVQDDLERALRTTESMVVIAGGDGTTRDVAKALRGRPVKLAILPQGTANNIAQALGWQGSLEEIIAGWKDARSVAIDAGVIEGPWGRSYFFESAGIGLFAEAMPQIAAYKKQMTHDFKSERDELHFDAEGLRELLAGSTPRSWQVSLDGVDHSGSYLLIEAMNINALGPSLRLAPNADPGDGLLDVVLVSPKERDLLHQHIASTTDSSFDTPPLTVMRRRKLTIEWNGAPLHADDAIWPAPEAWRQWADEAPHTLHLYLNPQAVTFLSNG